MRTPRPDRRSFAASFASGDGSRAPRRPDVAAPQSLVHVVEVGMTQGRGTRLQCLCGGRQGPAGSLELTVEEILPEPDRRSELLTSQPLRELVDTVSIF